MSKTLQLSALLLAAFCWNAFAQDGVIMIDEKDAEISGSWQHIAEDAKYSVGGDGFKFAMSVEANDPTSTATYRPNIPKAGKYNIEAFFCSGKNRSTKVPYLISSQDGDILITVDQNQGPAAWYRVADHVSFAAGSSGFVQVRNNCGVLPTQDKIVIADGIRFTLVGTSGGGTTEKGRYDLSVAADEGGTVKKDPDSSKYAANSLVTLTAEANPSFVFDSWSGDITGTENPVQVKMTRNTTISAKFTAVALGAILEAAEATFDGPWTTNAGKWGARADYRFAATVENGGILSSAVYRPKLSKKGLYDIYIWYASGNNRSSMAGWEIVSKKGTTKVEVNQQKNGGNWFPIATSVLFDAGSDDLVRLTNQTSQPGGVVVADSVAFVFVGEP